MMVLQTEGLIFRIVHFQAKHDKSQKDQTNRVWSILLIKHDLHGELHDGIDDIIGIVFEGLDGLGLGDIGLRHDQFHVLLLHARGINLRIKIQKMSQKWAEKDASLT